MSKFLIGEKAFTIAKGAGNYYIEEFCVTQITYNTKQKLYFYLYLGSEIHGNNVNYASEYDCYSTFDEALKEANKLIEKDESYYDK